MSRRSSRRARQHDPDDMSEVENKLSMAEQEIEQLRKELKKLKMKTPTQASNLQLDTPGTTTTPSIIGASGGSIDSTIRTSQAGHASPAPQPQPQVAPAPQPQPQAALAPQPQPQSAPAPQPQPQPAPAPQPQPQPAPAPQPQPQPQIAPAPQLQPQPRAAPAPQPQPRPQVAPAPQLQPLAAPAPQPQANQLVPLPVNNRYHNFRVPSPRQMEFDGKRPWGTFIKPFRELANACNWAGEERRFSLLHSLRDEAAEYVYSVLHQDTIDDLDLLERALEERFGEKNHLTPFLLHWSSVN